MVQDTAVERHKEGRVKANIEGRLQNESDMGHRARGWDVDSQGVLLAEQEVSEDEGRAALTLCCRSDPLPLLLLCNLSITVPHDYPPMSWVRREAFWSLVSG